MELNHPPIDQFLVRYQDIPRWVAQGFCEPKGLTYWNGSKISYKWRIKNAFFIIIMCLPWQCHMGSPLHSTRLVTDFVHGRKGGNIQNGQIISPMVSNWKVSNKSELFSRRVRHCSVSVPLHIFFYPLLTEKSANKKHKISLLASFFYFISSVKKMHFLFFRNFIRKLIFFEIFSSTLKKTNRCSFLGKLIEAFQSSIRWWPDFLSNLTTLAI